MSLEKINNNSMIIKYQNTDNVLEDVCSIIESARDYAYKSVNIALVERNWLIGYRIAEEELKGNDRADYGLEIIKKLSKELTKQYGKGYDSRNLYYFLNFYKFNGELKNLEPTKHSEWKWFDINNLPEQIYSPAKKFIQEYIKRNK